MGVPDESLPPQRKPEEMVQYMVEKGLTELPAEFKLPLHLRPDPQEKIQVDAVPVIDMALLNNEQGKAQVAAEIIRTCEEWGFFQIINHGVPATLMGEMMEMVRRFFALPSEEKEVLKRGNATSFQGYGRLFSLKPGDIRDWNDRLILDLPKASNVNDPAAYDVVVHNPPGFQDVHNEYGKALYEVGKQLMAVISQGLGHREDFLLEKLGRESLGVRTIINQYPPCPQPELALGVQPHSDGSAVTILQQSEVSGLEVLKDGSWISVSPCSPDALVVNLGDVFQIISNDRFKSALHRARAPTKTRISVASFIVPHGDLRLQPVAEICSEMNPARYRGVSYQEYMIAFMKMGLNTSTRAMDLFRLDPAGNAM